MTNHSFFSQFGEDEWILTHLKPPTSVFVEVGAADGIGNSNTYYLEKQCGWTGLCIEPDPRNYANLVRNRACQTLYCAIGSDPAKKVRMNQDRTLSGINTRGEQSGDYIGDSDAPVRMLEDVLQESGLSAPIGLLSIDVEGDELDVWSTFDNNRWKPQIVIIEFLSRNTEDNELEIARAFAALPYDRVHRTAANLIYVRSDRAGNLLR